MANPDAVITPATGGEAISIDTTSNEGSGTWTYLSGPKIKEGNIGDIAQGSHTITLPAGWEFDVSQNVNIGMETGGASGLVLGTNIITPTDNTLSFFVSNASGDSAETLTFNNIRVRPINQSVGSGNIIMTVGTISGVDSSTNFGTLTAVAGVVTQVAFTTQPGDAVYGSDLNPQPVVKTQDQFGNNSTNGLGSNNNVVLTLTGTGVLQGTATLDIGTNAGNGTVEFSGLTVDKVGTGKYLTANATGLTGGDSGLFEITALPITVTANAQTKTYGESDVLPFTYTVNPSLISGDSFSGALSRVGDENVGTYEIQQNDLTAGSNYIITYVPANLTITEKAIIVTANAVQTKIYGADDPTSFTYIYSPELESGDAFTGALSRVGGENVGTYAFSIGTLSAGTNYNLSVASTPTFSITPLSITGNFTVENKTYDGNTGAVILTQTLNAAIGGGSVALTGGTASFVDANVADSITVTASGMTLSGTNAGNYSLASVGDTTANITAKPINVTAQTDTKTYDGSNSSDKVPVVDTLASGDTIQTQPTQSFNTKDVGDSKTLTASGASINDGNSGNNYVISYVTASGSITAKELTVTGATSVSKTYDGDTIATVNFSSATLVGVTGEESVTLDSTGYSATFDNKNVGTGKTVTVSSLALTGDDAGNYSITQPVLTDGVINKKPINVTAQTDTKTYDGSNSSDKVPVVDTLASGDTIQTQPTQSFNTKDVGDSKTLTASGLVINDGNSGNNYAVTYVDYSIGVINKKPINVTAQTDTKTYDGSNSSDKVPVVDTLASGDTIQTQPTQSFNTKDVGDSKTLTASGASINDGNSGNNYVISYVTASGSITAKELTVTGATVTSKTYDGNTGAVISGATLSGVLSGDSVTLANDTSGAFDNKNVGTNKTVNTAMTITGTNAGNYSLTQPIVTGDITAKPITVTPAANTKVYDKTTAVATSPTITNGSLVTGDVAVFSATYDNANVDSGKTLTPSVTSIVDSSSDDMTGNYAVTLATADVGEITAKSVNVTAQTDTKTYDGDTTSNVSPVGDNLESGDTWASQGTQTYDTKNVGTGKVLTPAGASINDGNSGGNYVISYVTNETGKITAKDIIVTANAVQTKIYGADDPTSFTYIYSPELESGDAFTGALSRVGGENVGTYAFSIGTLSAGTNYNLSVASTPTFSITPLSITGNFTVENKTYDGNTGAVILTQTLNAAIGGGSVALTGGTASFVDANVADSITVTASGMTLSGTAAGNYSLTSVADTTANIIVLPITVTATSQTKIYGADDPDLTYTSNPALIGSDAFTGALSRVGGENIGDYEIQIGTLAAGSNYDITYVPANLTITKKAITVTADSQTKIYGADDPTSFTYIYSPELESGDAFTGALSRAIGENIGDYEIQIGTLAAGSNYDITYVLAYLTIADITAPFTIDNVPADWQNSDVTVTLTCNDSVGGDSGCSKVYYTTDENDPTTSSDYVDASSNWQFTMSIDGEYTVKYRGEDNAENLEEVKTADNLLRLDKTLPEIANLIPAHTSVTSDTTPTISAEFIENGSGVDTDSVVIVVGGVNQTDYSEVTTGGVTYEPIVPLAAGTYLVTVDVKDKVSNSAIQASWSFVVNPTVQSIAVSTDKTSVSVPADNASYAVITAQVLDNGNSVQGAAVDFASTLGTIFEATATDADGRATAKLKSAIAGNSVVTVSYSGGNELIQGTASVAFTETDTTPPTATQWPADNSINVPVDVNPTITFSEAMDESTISNTSIQLRKYDGTNIDKILNVSTVNGITTVTIIPNADLGYEAQYYFWISSTVKDLAEISFGDSWQSSQKANHEFKTIAEYVPATTYNIPLNPGWNLISLPLIPNSSAIVDVLGGISANVDIVKYYNSTTETWLSYIPGSGGSLTTMEDGKGYWVFMKTTGTLIITGAEMPAGGEMPASYSVVGNAWNLIGFKSVENMQVKNYINQIGNDDVLWGYKNGEYSTIHPSGSNTMEPGYGYWLYPYGNGYEIIPTNLR